MHSKHDNGNWYIRLDQGEELIQTLTDFCASHSITGGWLQAIGAVSKATLGSYNLQTKTYTWNTYEEPLEIASLTGNISILDKHILHLHGVFSKHDMSCVGGHVKQAVVSATCEITLRPTTEIKRSPDQAIGLPLWNLS